MKQINNSNDYYQRFCSPQQIERDFSNLIGLIDGITADKFLHEKELAGLANWLLQTKSYEGKSPYKELTEKLSEAISDHNITESEKSDIKWFCEHYIKGNEYYDLITRSIQELHGLLDGISLDGSVNEAEIINLHSWLDKNQFLKDKYPYQDVSEIIARVVQDGEISEDELNEVYQFCSLFKQSKLFDNLTTNDLVEHLVSSVFDEVQSFAIEGSKICVTGASKLYKRDEIKQIIQNKGGVMVSTVTKSTDFLVVCEERNACWAYSMYGRKVEEAINLKKAGAKVNILHIDDVYPFLNI